jgi:hypothetical protein
MKKINKEVKLPISSTYILLARSDGGIIFDNCEKNILNS